MAATRFIRPLEHLSSNDGPIVGGKNASLGEMIGALKASGIRVPDGFATTADAYWSFVQSHDLTGKIQSRIDDYKAGKAPLEQVGKAIRQLFLEHEFPEEIAAAIRSAYRELSQRCQKPHLDVAVRSSATAEDLPEASFAGQLETFLNIHGERQLLEACRKCFASLFTDRAIAYREEHHFDHMKIALSVGVQRMVRSDLAGAGVMFSIDTETGFKEVVIINAAWGLGENVVQGAINPDQYAVFKPLLGRPGLKPILEKVPGKKEKKMIYARGGTHPVKNIDTTKEERRSLVLNDAEILKLAEWAAAIEKHYGKPMDMEWAKDGETGQIFIVQARPETVHSQKKTALLKTYELKERAEPLLTGLAIGSAIASGKAQVLRHAEQIAQFQPGAILVTEMTDPDWVPIMRKSAGIITDYGGRTSHAAIVSRELGIPAVVGTNHATDTLKDHQEITLSCAEGDEGFIYPGKLPYEESELNLDEIPATKTKVMINIATPAASFRWWPLPTDGVGLARMEFIINNIIKIHPMALVRFDQVKDPEARRQIERLTQNYPSKSDYFVDHLASGIAKIAAPHFPRPVIVRLSDFKTNEYAGLIGGRSFEFDEANPMLGFRGASRYYSDRYQDGFALECRAIKRAREEIGLSNIIVMVPFCRTPEEADRVLDVMAGHGLKRGDKDFQIYVMCEIPSNVVLADEFAKRFDGFSIGSNDLTQLVLGIDRDSAELRGLFDERHPAVKRTIQSLIQTAHQAGRKVGICGEAPSNYPEFAEFLVQNGIDSISLNPDSFIKVKERIAKIEALAGVT